MGIHAPGTLVCVPNQSCWPVFNSKLAWARDFQNCFQLYVGLGQGFPKLFSTLGWPGPGISKTVFNSMLAWARDFQNCFQL